MNPEQVEEYEKSATKIQAQFRGVKARKTFEDEQQKAQEDAPTPDIAKPTENKLVLTNPNVKNTFERLNEVKIPQGRGSNDPLFKEARFLGPHVIIVSIFILDFRQ